MFVDWVAVQGIATSVLVLTSAGAIGYASLQLRHEREYREVENLEKQLGFFLAENFVRARRRLAEARLDLTDPANPKFHGWEIDSPPVSAFEVLDFYEHLSLLVKKGHLNLYDVWHTFYEWAQPVYVDLQQMIESEDSPYAEHYNDLQRLMRRMDEIQIRKMHKKKANHWALWTPERIIEHYRYELESGGRPRRTRRQPDALAVAREVAREVVKEIEVKQVSPEASGILTVPSKDLPEWPEGAAPPTVEEAAGKTVHA